MPGSDECEGRQARAATFWGLPMLLVAVFAALGLAACGGGGGGGNPGGGGSGGPNATDDTPTTTSLTESDGLTGDANQQHRLFYVDASRDNGETGLGHAADPWLMAYNPLTEDTETIDEEFSWISSNVNIISPLVLHQADINVSSGEIENYQLASVSYVQGEPPTPPNIMSTPSRLMRVGVAAGSVPQQVSDESGSSADLGFIAGPQLVSFNLKNANQARYVFPADASTSSSRQYRLTSMNADASTPVKDFGADLSVQRPLFATQGAGAGSAYGWLVVDQTENDCLAFVSSADLTSATCIPNADGAGGNVPLEQDGDSPSSYISGSYPLDSGVVLALPADTSNPLRVTTTLWFYERNSSGGPGTLHLLKNADGESLKTTGLTLFGPDEAGRVVSKGGDTLYLAASDGGIGGLFGTGSPTDPSDIEFHSFLFKINTTAGNIGWQQIYHEGGKLLDGEAAVLGDFLLDAGTHLIWEINERLIAISLDGQSEILLDGRSSSGSSLVHGAFNTPAGAISQGGWFFYNREANQSDYAVAIKVDGSKRLELKDCTWIGASTSGKAQYTGGSFSSLEPSEVFMACNNREIAAIDANDPLAGRVILGSLGEPAESIAMGRTAPGPNRLIRVVYNDERYEVLYANTREKDSLKHLMASPASEDSVGSLAGQTAPVNGF